MKAVKEFFKNIMNKDFLISISCLMILQALIYYFIKFCQSDYHYFNSIIDSKIPFIPLSVYIYDIFYPFVFLIFYYIFCKDKKTYYNGIIAGIIGYLICDIIFLTYPTIMVRNDISGVNMDFLTSLVVKITYLYDEPPLNCFPSIHCLFCFQVIVTTIFSKNIKVKNKIIISIISLLIIISTLLVKQHYFYDVIGALIICIISNIALYITKRILFKK